jgi:hypothetical protein
VPGFRGGYLLRREAGSEDEFPGHDALRLAGGGCGFAGDDYEVPVIEPEAARLLSRGDERAARYEVAIVVE